MSFRLPAQPETPPPPPPPPPPAPDHRAALAELELWRVTFPLQTPRGVQNHIETLGERVSELEALVVVRGEQLAQWEAKFPPDPNPKPKKAKAKKAKK